jgi:E3 ubiquitin-protein ligase SHPRH
VKRATLNATFPSSKPRVDDDKILQRLDAPVAVSVKPLQDGTYNIKIEELLGRNRSNLLDDTISAENLPLRDIELIGRVTGTGHVQRSDGQGRLWAQTDIRMGHKDGLVSLEITFTLNWNITTTIEHLPSRNKSNRLAVEAILDTYYPRADFKAEGTKPWSPQDFYRSVHVPTKDDPVAASIVTSQLDTDLYPFQKRSLKWLLGREGKKPSVIEGFLEDRPEELANNELPYSFQEVVDERGQICYVSSLFLMVVLDIEPYRMLEKAQKALRGGILSEEMGLGKTVEIIALISLHRRKLLEPSGTVFDPYTSTTVRESSATLIITPPAILSQWKSELAKHAPGLKVIHYTSSPHRNREDGGKETLDSLATCDVVLCTYDTLGRELVYTIPPPDRHMRRASKYERPKSPLIQISWWRVCLDEAQMVESGVSRAAEVAVRLPRINAWAVTGTPIKTDVSGKFFFVYHSTTQ